MLENIETILLQIADRLEKIESKQDQNAGRYYDDCERTRKIWENLDTVTDQVEGLTESNKQHQSNW